MTPQASAPGGRPRPAEAPLSEEAPDAQALLRMSVGSDILAVPIQDVREIIQISRMTPLPRTPAFVRGVMNLRGAVVPVIDLAARLGGPATRIGRRSCIVVVASPDNADGDGERGMVVGLQVDAVHEVFARRADEVEGVPNLGTSIDPHFLAGMTRAAGQVIGILSLATVVEVESLTAAIAGQAPH